MSTLEGTTVEQASATSRNSLLSGVSAAVHERVVGQEEAVEGLLIGLLTGGHVLLEGLPGLAKTLMVRTLAQAIYTGFRRIQFTPDLLPTDIVGTPVFDQSSGEFRVQKGPIFSNIILADEINRAPPKVQAALLEAMEERQVTIAGETYPLENPFMVLATQNPVELHGTYELTFATREPAAFGLEDLVDLIEFGTSPRATIFLTRTAKARAYLAGRDYVLPDDVKAVAPKVLRHRLRTTYEADARGVDADEITRRVLAAVPAP